MPRLCMHAHPRTAWWDLAVQISRQTQNQYSQYGTTMGQGGNGLGCGQRIEEVRESLGSACKETEKGYLMDIQNIITFFSLLVNVLAVITFYITVRKYRDENKKGEMI